MCISFKKLTYAVVTHTCCYSLTSMLNWRGPYCGGQNEAREINPRLSLFLITELSIFMFPHQQKDSPLHTLGAFYLCSPATQLTPHQTAHLQGVYCQTTARLSLTLHLTYITCGVKNSPLTVLRKHAFSFGVCVRFSLCTLPWVFIKL